jgi:hypothetical protein
LLHCVLMPSGPHRESSITNCPVRPGYQTQGGRSGRIGCAGNSGTNSQPAPSVPKRKSPSACGAIVGPDFMRASPSPSGGRRSRDSQSRMREGQAAGRSRACVPTGFKVGGPAPRREKSMTRARGHSRAIRSAVAFFSHHGSAWREKASSTAFAAWAQAASIAASVVTACGSSSNTNHWPRPPGLKERR